MELKTKDNIELHYETYGCKTNPAIVLAHGLGANYKMFTLQLEKYANEGYFVIAPDMRGHGRTSKVDSLQLSDWTKDIKELLDYLEVETATLLGVSMGGVIVQKFACEYPARVDKLVIVDSFGELKTFIEKAVGWIQVVSFNFFKLVPNELTAKLFASNYRKLSPKTAEYFKETVSKADFGQLVLARKAINQIDILEKLKEIEIPALILVGDELKFMVEISKKIASSLNNSQFKVLEGAMDPSNLVAPKRFNKEVLEFIK